MIMIIFFLLLLPLLPLHHRRLCVHTRNWGGWEQQQRNEKLVDMCLKVLEPLCDHSLIIHQSNNDTIQWNNVHWTVLDLITACLHLHFYYLTLATLLRVAYTHCLPLLFLWEPVFSPHKSFCVSTNALNLSRRKREGSSHYYYYKFIAV